MESRGLGLDLSSTAVVVHGIRSSSKREGCLPSRSEEKEDSPWFEEIDNSEQQRARGQERVRIWHEAVNRAELRWSCYLQCQSCYLPWIVIGCYVPDSPSESRRSPAGFGCPKSLFTLGGNCDCLGGRRSPSVCSCDDSDYCSMLCCCC